MQSIIALTLLVLLTACGGSDGRDDPTLDPICNPNFVGPLSPAQAASAAVECPK